MKTRILSAAVALVLAVIILALSKTIVFYLAISAITVVMLYELFGAIHCKEYKMTTSILYLFAFVMPLFLYEGLQKYQIIAVNVCVLLIFLSFLAQHKTLSFEKLFSMLAGCVLITLSMCSMITLKNSSDYGLFLLVLSLCGAWLADSGAYFAGTLCGKHKLCPEISPKKTVEGLIGGCITNVLLFVIIGLGYTYIKSKSNIHVDINYVIMPILGVICAFLGVLGDLTASLIKRQSHIKDYGNIMPGHGGLLDRFDSALFVVPFMSLATGYLNIIK